MNPTITTDPKHVSFLRHAYEAAHIQSDDPDTHNGAVLVGPYIKYLARVNSVPFGIKMLPERLKRPVKYNYIEHAERNVIYAAAREGLRVEGSTLYCPWVTCIECARAIIASRIQRVIGHKAMMDRTPARWKESIETAFEMLNEAGIETILYDGQIGNCKARLDGKDWLP